MYYVLSESNENEAASKIKCTEDFQEEIPD